MPSTLQPLWKATPSVPSGALGEEQRTESATPILAKGPGRGPAASPDKPLAVGAPPPLFRPMPLTCACYKGASTLGPPTATCLLSFPIQVWLCWRAHYRSVLVTRKF